MPLKEGYSKESIAHNIRAELSAGRERDQALAIALSKAREARKRREYWLGGTTEATKQDDDLANQFPERQDTSGDPKGEYEDEEESEGEHGRRYSDGGVVQDTLKEGLKPPTSFMKYDYQMRAPHTVAPKEEHFDLSRHDPHFPEEDMTEMAKKLKKHFFTGRY